MQLRSQRFNEKFASPLHNPCSDDGGEGPGFLLRQENYAAYITELTNTEPFLSPLENTYYHDFDSSQSWGPRPKALELLAKYVRTELNPQPLTPWF